MIHVGKKKKEKGKTNLHPHLAPRSAQRCDHIREGERVPGLPCAPAPPPAAPAENQHCAFLRCFGNNLAVFLTTASPAPAQLSASMPLLRKPSSRKRCRKGGIKASLLHNWADLFPSTARAHVLPGAAGGGPTPTNRPNPSTVTGFGYLLMVILRHFPAMTAVTRTLKVIK